MFRAMELEYAPKIPMQNAHALPDQRSGKGIDSY
jgi:hypothetical protein